MSFASSAHSTGPLPAAGAGAATDDDPLLLPGVSPGGAAPEDEEAEGGEALTVDFRTRVPMGLSMAMEVRIPLEEPGVGLKMHCTSMGMGGKDLKEHGMSAKRYWRARWYIMLGTP